MKRILNVMIQVATLAAATSAGCGWAISQMYLDTGQPGSTGSTNTQNFIQEGYSPGGTGEANIGGGQNWQYLPELEKDIVKDTQLLKDGK